MVHLLTCILNTFRHSLVKDNT